LNLLVLSQVRGDLSPYEDLLLNSGKKEDQLGNKIEQSIRILGIIGSPRRGGNTEILIDEILKGAGEAGASTGKIALGELNIAPCRACETCKKAGRCVIEDDMTPLLEKMEQCDIWVMGSPVYFWGPTAQFKAFLDRWYGARYHLKLEERRIIVVIPLEDTNVKTARHLKGMLKDTLNYLKTKLITTIIVPGVNEPGAVREHPSILAEARSTGMVSVLKMKPKRSKDAALCTPEKCS